MYRWSLCCTVLLVLLHGNVSLPDVAEQTMVRTSNIFAQAGLPWSGTVAEIRICKGYTVVKRGKNKFNAAVIWGDDGEATENLDISHVEGPGNLKARHTFRSAGNYTVRIGISAGCLDQGRNFIEQCPSSPSGNGASGCPNTNGTAHVEASRPPEKVELVRDNPPRYIQAGSKNYPDLGIVSISEGLQSLV